MNICRYSSLPSLGVEFVFCEIKNGYIFIFKLERLALYKAHISADLHHHLLGPVLKGTRSGPDFIGSSLDFIGCLWTAPACVPAALNRGSGLPFFLDERHEQKRGSGPALKRADLYPSSEAFCSFPSSLWYGT